MSSSPLDLDHLVIPRIIGPRILDVGCGYGKWGFLAKTHGWTFGCVRPWIVGVDLFVPHLASLRKTKIYDGLVAASASNLPYENGAFETVIAMEVIEHLQKEDGKMLLKEVERVAKRRVIFSTPAFPDLRGGLDTLDGFNAHEAHVSFWSRREFRSRGYNVYGAGLRYGPSKVRQVLGSVSLAIPFLGAQILAIKDLDRSRT